MKVKANVMVRRQIERSGLRHYELAELVGISRFTLCNWLKEPLTKSRKQRIIKALENAKTE